MNSISWKQNRQVVKESRTINPRRQSPFGLFLRIEPLRVVRRPRGHSGQTWLSVVSLSFSFWIPALGQAPLPWLVMRRPMLVWLCRMSKHF